MTRRGLRLQRAGHVALTAPLGNKREVSGYYGSLQERAIHDF